MAEITLYHNPRCSKSRQTLELLRERGVEPQLVLYLQQPPSADRLRDLLGKLGLSPRQLMRRGEAIYSELKLDDSTLTDAALINAMVEHPQLIERPIAVRGDRAVLGRPPENVLALVADV